MARKGGSAEIAALKQAEAEAQLIVNQAREERKLKMKQAQADAKREIDEYRAMRDAKLRSVQPEVGGVRLCFQGRPRGGIHARPMQAQALLEKIRRITADTNRTIGDLE